MIHQTKIELVNTKHEQIFGKELLVTVDTHFKLDKITAVREYLDEESDQPSPEKCVIYLEVEGSFIIHTPYKEMLRLFYEANN
jgi:hypothetical protein